MLKASRGKRIAALSYPLPPEGPFLPCVLATGDSLALRQVHHRHLLAGVGLEGAPHVLRFQLPAAGADAGVAADILCGIGIVAKLENGFCFSSLRISSTIGR